MNQPRQQILTQYQKRHGRKIGARMVDRYLDWARRDGYVIDTAQVFFAAVRKRDEWHVLFASGKNSLKAGMDACPHPMPLVSWYRCVRGDNRRRIINFTRLKRILNP